MIQLRLNLRELSYDEDEISGNQCPGMECAVMSPRSSELRSLLVENHILGKNYCLAFSMTKVFLKQPKHSSRSDPALLRLRYTYCFASFSGCFWIFVQFDEN